MPVYSRSFLSGANPLPAWRQAMTNTNTLYRLTTQTHDPALRNTIVWPGGQIPTRFGSIVDAIRVHEGYGSAVLAEDVGPFGTHVYTGTGEDVFSDQMSAINLGADSPVWSWWQQPYFPLSEAEAISSGSDWYYSPTAADALPTNRKIVKTSGYMLPSDWDGQFPISLPTSITGSGGGWVQIRKAERTLGFNRSLAMRYNAPCYVPPSMTGTGAGAILTNDDTFSGPFIGNNGKPANVGNPSEGLTFNTASYWADVWPNGNQKVYVRAMNTQTKAWTRLTGAAMDPPPGAEIVRNASFVDHANKRVYYRTGNVLYYIDLANGLAGATRSAYTSCSSNGFIGVDINAAHCPCEKNPTGRRLMYFKTSSSSTRLHMLDIDAQAFYDLDLSARGLNFNGVEWIGMGYDPARNRVFMTYQSAANTAILCSSFAIPSDPTVAANYTIDTVTLGLGGGATLEAYPYRLHFGRHCQYISSLGVIVYQQKDQAPLVFRPA